MATALLKTEGRRTKRDIVSFRAPLAPGDIVAIRLPVVGARAARIIWSMGGRVGGEFVEVIGADVYRRMLADAPNDKPAWNEF